MWNAVKSSVIRVRGLSMSNVIPFPQRPIYVAEDDVPALDLLTAVDVAIRDLRDIATLSIAPAPRELAETCMRMLEQAFAVAAAEQAAG